MVEVEEAKPDIVEDQVKPLTQGDSLVVGLGECFDGFLLCVGERKINDTCRDLYIPCVGSPEP